MPTKPRKTTKPPERDPLYDPAVHTDPEQLVYTELYCECGSLWRQRDPVSYVAPRVAEFLAVHAGRGHGPTSKADCVDAREARRKASFLAAGRADDYQPREYPRLDVADTTPPRPWPAFPDPDPDSPEAQAASPEGAS